MTTTTGFAHDTGLFPVEPSGEAPPIRPTTFENDRFPNGQPSLRNQASRAISHFLITFCSGAAASVAWQWYGDAVREMIAKSYPRLGWLAPRPLSTAQNTRAMSGLAAPAAPFDQQQLNTSLDAMRQSIDRLAAAHEQILRRIGQIATRTAAGQKQMAGSIDQTDADSAQTPPAKVSGITVESLTEGTSLQPTVRLNMRPTEVRLPQTLSERGKQFSAMSGGHDASCFPSASAVIQNHPGGWPTWTLRAPGREGTMCWYAAARPGGSDHPWDGRPA
jgi:hypothetical protein